jgi:type I restriction enzyme R subunit
VSDRTQVIEEYFVAPLGGGASGPVLSDKSAQFGSREFSDYVLLGKNGRPLAVVEAKQSSKNAELGREQSKQYCQNIQAQLGGELPFCFYTNGHEIFFWNLGEAPQQKVHGFHSRQDLERLLYIRKYKKPLTNELINTTIAGRDFQVQAIRSVMEGVWRVGLGYGHGGLGGSIVLGWKELRGPGDGDGAFEREDAGVAGSEEFGGVGG